MNKDLAAEQLLAEFDGLNYQYKASLSDREYSFSKYNYPQFLSIKDCKISRVIDKTITSGLFFLLKQSD